MLCASVREIALDTTPQDILRLRGVVTAVHEGNRGFASTFLEDAVGRIPEGTHITFSLVDWQSDVLPRKGQLVTLERVTLFEKGWRALRARPIRIEGERQRGEFR